MTSLNMRSSLLPIGARCAALCCGAVALGAKSLVGGCGGNEPEEQVVVAPPPAPVELDPVPTVTSIETLMAQLGIDRRVRLSEDQAPDTDAARIAVLKFFDAFVRSDNDHVAEMLAGPDRVELERMVARGAWIDATESIERVDVRTGRNELGDDCVLAVFHVGMAFEPQLWTYEVSSYGSEFAAEPTPPGIIDKLSGSDWIAAWYRILADELARAEEPDEQVTVRSVNHDTSETIEAQDSGPAPTGPIQPGGPGRRPIGEPIRAPGRWPGS